MTSTTHAELFNFVTLRERFNGLSNGQRADLRRAAAPEDLRMTPALYRLLRGMKPNAPYLRVAFLLPWAKHQPKAAHFSAQCAKANINEMRMFQIARSDDPMDMIQLRRIAMQIEPHVEWNQFGKMLWFWDKTHTKREFIENYYLSQYAKKEENHDNA